MCVCVCVCGSGGGGGGGGGGGEVRQPCKHGGFSLMTIDSEWLRCIYVANHPDEKNAGWQLH